VGFFVYEVDCRIWFAGNILKSAGGEAANAQVCKTCIRGFNSRPALQKLVVSIPSLMSRTRSAL
jgi:hypothetical protein